MYLTIQNYTLLEYVTLVSAECYTQIGGKTDIPGLLTRNAYNATHTCNIFNEVNMEALLWIIFILVIGKALLKAVAPYANRTLDDKLKGYWEDLKIIFNLGCSGTI